MTTTLVNHPQATVLTTEHPWTDNRGRHHVPRMDHSDTSCLRAATGTALDTIDGDAWPCPDCFLDRPTRDNGPDGDRRDSIDAPTGRGGPATGQGPTNAPSDKQVRFLTALLRGSVAATPEWADGTLSAEDAEGIVWTVACAAAESKTSASKAIDRLMGQAVRPVWDALQARPTPATPERTNRYAGPCGSCGHTVPAETGALVKGPKGWQVFHVGQCPAAPVAPAEPQQQDLPDVPAGHYAITSTGTNDLAFYRVDRPTTGSYAGRVFVKLVVGGRPDSNVRASHVPGILARITEAGITEAARLYGQEIGRCSRCNRHLTDEESRTLGIGPECRKKGAL